VEVIKMASTQTLNENEMEKGKLYITRQEMENDLADEEWYVLNMDLEWQDEGVQYLVARAVADGRMPISELRKYKQWHKVLRWMQRQVDTIKIIQTFEKPGLTLTDDQVKALHEAIWAEDVRPGFVSEELEKLFSFETKERIERLDFSKWGYHLLSKWYWMINRISLKDVPDDSVQKLFLSKIVEQMESEELLEGEQKTLEEMKKVIGEIGSLMDRIGQSASGEEDLPAGQEAA
jgi:hypothetical protein